VIRLFVFPLIFVGLHFIIGHFFFFLPFYGKAHMLRQIHSTRGLHLAYDVI